MRNLLLILGWLATSSASAANQLNTAEAFVDAFYSFKPEQLTAIVAPGEDQDNILYYQAWAEAAHYKVKDRKACEPVAGNSVSCAVTVTDDFGQTLGYTATDTFTLTTTNNKITSVTFEGDDPLVFYMLYIWMRLTKAEIFDGPCKDMFAGGTEPANCARAVADSATEFMSWWPF